ncbi:UNVERIFIED_ORG: poly(hydroxyalkanoate) depolymerase family esterase [Methylobacterium sp. SuP10 SLI 274]|uniref:extracellular catalytic domain type 1 short-chain-length polyhydroxyalkanoate depolymerase n=1 Tax=Methylorubrum extorquens TaxID=408 RepID=UPI00209FBD91|nr:PHB depolymerase family esterase [Methylorubrum extorquens]MDF9863861.1 poly(hydroxyalkanoate) depolymerase family esterase [Methylorubrum pseudosasae]MDH6637459.1 poly(hydroxyalkanoate) depolymerase family esterase [Methylobacterium sp. SuP10 SLI 274]MDH6666639.1 poly(hydroxyalkanoate) depolymerase family esterase [Methylorubrum zatmanii]MCP1558549.1 poly(hydroxyalkanoate) depolymerase family esterase [Methylorubrum extorquens]MDF9792176.1 poly(hydroxyalkanoate) depolymerase family esteras
MNAFSGIDMGEVTRLTRAGQLTEAMALLQGRPASAQPQAGTPEGAPDKDASTARPASTIDMVAPRAPGGAWTALGFGQGTAGEAPTDRTSPSERQGLAETLRSLRERFPKMGGISGLADGLGSPQRAPIPVPDGARYEERTFSNAAGSRTYKVYVPSGYTGQALPLVVMLHGCTQSPDDFAAGTRMNALAEEQTFLVAYPGQPQSANMQKCWNWFNAADQQRGSGEPSLIAGIAQDVIREFSADPRRVYVAGLSAGGAAAAIMAATYPDLFAAIGVHSGLPYGAAKDMPSAFAAMNGGGTARPPGARVSVPTIVFHGDADRTVNAANGDRIIAQAKPEGALETVVTHGESPGGMPYTRSVQSDPSGRAVLEQWVLHGAGHAWSGGSPNGTYTDPRGPDASREMVRFFMAHTGGSDTRQQ